jgi:hypothetical protein
MKPRGAARHRLCEAIAAGSAFRGIYGTFERVHSIIRSRELFPRHEEYALERDRPLPATLLLHFSLRLASSLHSPSLFARFAAGKVSRLPPLPGD